MSAKKREGGREREGAECGSAFSARVALLARSLARSTSLALEGARALCNESDGVYLSEQERVPPPPRAAKDGMGVSGRAGSRGEGGDASEAVRAPSC